MTSFKARPLAASPPGPPALSVLSVLDRIVPVDWLVTELILEDESKRVGFILMTRKASQRRLGLQRARRKMTKSSPRRGEAQEVKRSFKLGAGCRFLGGLLLCLETPLIRPARCLCRLCALYVTLSRRVWPKREVRHQTTACYQTCWNTHDLNSITSWSSICSRDARSLGNSLENQGQRRHGAKTACTAAADSIVSFGLSAEDLYHPPLPCLYGAGACDEKMPDRDAADCLSAGGLETTRKSVLLLASRIQDVGLNHQ